MRSPNDVGGAASLSVPVWPARAGQTPWARGGLRWAILLVVAAHAAALLPIKVGLLRGASSASVTSMQVRMVQAAQPQAAVPVPVVPPVSTEPVATRPAVIQSAPPPNKLSAGPSRPAEPVAVQAEPPRPVTNPSPVQATPALPPAPEYLGNAQLDPGPAPLSEIAPEYPDAAGSLKGSVTLRLLISDKGIVDDASVVRAAPPGVFDAAAVTAFKAALFSPGRMLGIPVKSQLTIVVEFTPAQRSDLSARKY